MEREILDACCGSKMFWFNKNHPGALYMDIRKEEHVLCDGRKLSICPDVVADYTDMPFENETFSLVVFDPPHLVSAGQKSYMRLKYGQLGHDWKEELRKGFSECWRVLKPNGTLIFKWSEVQIKLSEILPLFPVNPLLGQLGRGRTKTQTHWIVFFKDVNNGAK
jgi:SAM-dependent methyltransferase